MEPHDRPQRRSAIAVVPSAELRRRQPLFDALSTLLDVSFVDGEHGTATFDAVVAIGRVDLPPPLVALPRFEAPTEADFGTDWSTVSFDGAHAEPVLRGRSLRHRAFGQKIDAQPGEEILAEADGQPVWARRAEGDRVSAGFGDLVALPPVSEFLRAGSFMPLLPLIDFVRERTSRPFALPPLRASFMFDDPNLHAGRYGYLDLRETVSHARRAGFHVSLATIPLDTWFAAPGARELVRAHPQELSLLVHGNDHVRRELARDTDPAAVRARLAQALRRIERFEARYGVAVDRVMAPPHGACSEAAAVALLELAFEALCVSRPYPWLAEPPATAPLAGWRMTDTSGTGLPILPRIHLSSPREEIVLRAFLRHPLVLYGHHEDMAPGLQVLDDAAEDVSRLGDVHWQSAGSLARSSVEVGAQGAESALRLHSRRVSVRLDDEVRRLTVTTGSPPDPRDRLAVEIGAWSTEQPFEEGSATVEVPHGGAAAIRLVGDRAGLPPVASPRFSPWPYARRACTELRDRGRARICR